MSLQHRRFFLCVVFLVGGSWAFALSLPRIFGDHMVLQSGQPNRVWGWATPGEAVTVRFAGQEKHATAAAGEGRWEVQLEPLAVSTQAAELTVAGAETLTFKDVVVGEVWLCSGQSNMAKPVGEWIGQKPTLNHEAELRAADFPLIRLFKPKQVSRGAPERDFDQTRRAGDRPFGGWLACSASSLEELKFSAAGYFFGRQLFRELRAPIGLIDSSWGGSRIELWTPAEGFARLPSLTALANAAFAAAARQPGARAEGVVPCGIYNGMIAPLVPFALRGAIWYQGESNVIDVNDGPRYLDKMVALVQGWRGAWGADLSFYYVQIAPHLYHVVRPGQVVSPEATPRLWEAQTAAMARLPRTGMIVTTDLVDDLNDIHPRNKRDVGERLARWALARDYGRSDVVFSGPLFRSLEVQGDRAVLSFDYVGGGLVSRDRKPLSWFIIAGADGEFFPGKAEIVGDTVVVSSPKVAVPRTVRFAWDEAAQPNLVNRAGLPAVPFRTDNPLTADPGTTSLPSPAPKR
jgi:sialate O-acetylesterase